MSGNAFAQQSSSTNYQVNEVYFGNGGELNACSASYCSKQAAGELAVGNAASNNYQMQAGFNTSDVPILEVAVTGGVFDLGILDTATTHTVQTSFTVRNYLSMGYVVRLRGSTPTNPSSGHVLAAMSTPAGASTGSEQFGVNLRANTSPSVGADPQQLPDSTYSFGTPSTDYNTPNQFKFVDNDVIASSNKSSGQTQFTLSAIANIANRTPAGDYGGILSVIVVPTF